MDKQNICKFNFNRSGDLICTNFVSEKNDSMREEMTLGHHRLYLVTHGEGVFSLRSKQRSAGVGDIFLVPAGERSSIRSSGSLEYCYIDFTGRRGDELISRIDFRYDDIVCCDGSDLIPFWLRCINEADKRNIDLISEAVLLYTLAKLKPSSSEQSDLISTVISVTGDNFSDSDFNLLSLAAKIGYDDKYVSSAFKKSKGITYSQYLRELRLHHALFLIEQGLVSVKNVAILSGFGDPLYFSKVFKTAQGMTPKEYIKIIQKSKQGTE